MLIPLQSLANYARVSLQFRANPPVISLFGYYSEIFCSYRKVSVILLSGSTKMVSFDI